MRRALLAGLVLLAACAGGPTRVPTPPPLVPWVDAPAPPVAPPAPAPVPPGTPWCTASQLSTAPGLRNGAGGMAYGGILIANRGARACHLRGVPRVSLRTSPPTRAVPRPAPDPPDSDVLLEPGREAGSEPAPGEAALTLAWNSRPEWPGCSGGAYALTELDISLPDGSTLVAPLAGLGGGACLDQAGVQVMAFQSTLLMLPPSPPPAGLGAVIERPPAVRPGAQLEYVVDLTNSGRAAVDLAAAGCPGYRAVLSGPQKASYSDGRQLNCDAAGPIAPGTTRRLAMRLELPGSAPPGDYTIDWWIQLWAGKEAEATARVTVLR